LSVTSYTLKQHKSQNEVQAHLLTISKLKSYISS
jgi:hypothetical protein